MKNNEQEIIQGLKCGDERAYKYIYDHHYVLLCCIAYEYVKDMYLAETIVGDAIFHLWEIRESLDISTSLRTYLARTVHNRSINYLDLKHVRTEIAFSAATTLPEEMQSYSDEYPLDKLLKKELEQTIQNSVNRLPNDCRKAFVKSRFEDKKYEEIAKEMNISIHTVKYHVKNAVVRLQKDLSKYLISILALIWLG